MQNSIRNEVPVEGLCLMVNQTLPDIKSIPEWEAMQEAEAQKIVDALVQALPGGVTNRVACLLMTRMVGALGIPLETK